MIKKIVLIILLLVLPASLIFATNYVDALQKAIWFFDANKCGPQAGNHNVQSWRSACHITDGSAVGLNLTGGYHDAGDHVKFGLPQAYMISMLGWALYEYRSMFDSQGLTTKMLDTIKYGTDYFLRAHPNANTFYYHVGDGYIDHGYWGSPEYQSGARPVLAAATPTDSCSDITALTASALALMYLNYQSIDYNYAQQCKQAAIEIYNIALNNNSRGSDGSGGGRTKSAAFYGTSAHYDDLSWGAIWLYEITGETSYLAPVMGWQNIPGDYGGSNWEFAWAPTWDNLTPYVLLKMAQIDKDDKYWDGVIYTLEWARDRAPHTPGGLLFIDGQGWGNLRLASGCAGTGFLAAKLIGYSGFRTEADTIIDYILGDNPRNASYMTGWGNNPPLHPHHRGNEPNRDGNTSGMIGALVGGPHANDSFNDNVNDYIYNEVAIDYNASFVLALAGRAYFSTGGQSTSSTPAPVVTPKPTSTPTPAPGVTATPTALVTPPPVPAGELVVQYRCQVTTASTNQIGAYFQIINNSSATIPISELVIRYYYEKEGTVAEQGHIDYSALGSNNVAVIPYASYYEVTFTSGAGNLVPGASTGGIQTRINKTDWSLYNQSNDYSFNSAITQYTTYSRVALYRKGQLIWGNPGTNPVPTVTPVVTATPSPTPAPVSTATPVVTATPSPSPAPVVTATPLSAGAFRESGGQVVMEAENYSFKVDRNGDGWNLKTANYPYTGSGYMLVGPDDGSYWTSGWAANSAELKFSVNFSSTGTYYLWVRGAAPDASSDSYHAGLDGAELTTTDNLSLSRSSSAMNWNNKSMDGSRATISVTSTGIHIFNLWMREDGAMVDKIILTKDSAYTPSGDGPAQSTRS